MLYYPYSGELVILLPDLDFDLDEAPVPPEDELFLLSLVKKSKLRLLAAKTNRGTIHKNTEMSEWVKRAWSLTRGFVVGFKDC